VHGTTGVAGKHTLALARRHIPHACRAIVAASYESAVRTHPPHCWRAHVSPHTAAHVTAAVCPRNTRHSLVASHFQMRTVHVWPIKRYFYLTIL
jgi:hypothetical protein